MIDKEAKDVSWYYNPLPEMNSDISGYKNLQWTGRDPYTLEQGAACRAYKQMNDESVQCTVDGKPSSPSTYKVMVDTLAETIHSHAPVREVTWGEKTPSSLTGHRLKAFLEAGVVEINKAGPVPDNELWRLIAEERCMADLNAKVESYFGGHYQKINDKVNTVRMDPHINEEDIATMNSTLNGTWKGAE